MRPLPDVTTARGVADVVASGLCIGLVAAKILDLVFPMDVGTYSETLGSGGRLVPHFVRGAMTVAMLTYLAVFGPRVNRDCSRLSRRLIAFAVVLVLQVLMDHDRIGVGVYVLGRYLYWILGMLVFYRLAFLGALTGRRVVITAGTVTFLGACDTLLESIEGLSGPELVGVQGAYSLLWGIPLLLLHRNSRLAKAVIALAAYAMLLTLKRGALIALVVCTVAYAAASLKLHFSARNVCRAILVVLGVALFAAITLTPHWEYLTLRWADFHRAGEGIGSGRGVFYRLILYRWLGADITTKVFGFGFFSVKPFLGEALGLRIFAHSDWLETLHDQGLVGVVLFLSIHLAILAIIRHGFACRHPVTPMLVFGYVTFVLVNIYSGSVTYTILMDFSLLVGYAGGVIGRAQVLARSAPMPRPARASQLALAGGVPS